MVGWPSGRLAGHLRKDSVGEKLPISAQDASTHQSRTWLPKGSLFKWITPSRWRKPTIAKVFIIAILNFAWTYAVLKYYTGRQSSPLVPTDDDLNDLRITEDATHHIFRNPKPKATSRNALNIRAYDSMTDACVEEWVVHHEWGSSCIGTDLSEGLKVDGVWAWVNGSDPLQIASRQRYRPSGKMKMDATHRYQEHDELLFSMRSAVESLGTKAMQRLHILASAYHTPNGNEHQMAGQVPAWLDKEQAFGGDARVRLHHDAQYFKPISGPGNELSPLELQGWKNAVIPSFNSLAVEAQIHNIEDTTSDQLVYFNDDFFTLRKIAVSDFTTPLYGPVIKTFTRATSKYLPAENTLYRWLNPTGEEPGIKRAAWVLGKRFAMRPYYYITHHPRTLWLPLLLETAQTFPEAFSDTPLSRFRAQNDVPMSVQTVFLGSWYAVERHREALLWTWAVAKWGGKNRNISSEKKELMWNELARNLSSSTSFLDVGVPVRDPVENIDILKKAKIDVPTSTEYSFSSKDGYALSYVDSMWSWDRPRHGYPDLTRGLIEQSPDTAGATGQTRFSRDPNHSSAKACSIVRSTCFGSAATNETASDFFKRIAFEQRDCGDCIITALIGASGNSGIDKFLPSADIKMSSISGSGAGAGPPHLPLTSDWLTTDFSMPGAIPKASTRPGMTLRTWCTRLIQRYSYVLGSVGADFYKVERANKLETELDGVQRKVEEDAGTTEVGSTLKGENTGPLAFLCLNDDIKETGELRDRVDNLLSDFFRKMWTSKLSFERAE